MAEIERMQQSQIIPTTTPIVLRQSAKFPVERRPTRRELSEDPQERIDDWFKNSGIEIREAADTFERQASARRLLYTWKDCFIKRIRDIKPTDLLYHSIDLRPKVKTQKSRVPRYTIREREFAARIFPEMEEAGIIVRGASDWGARTRFVPKKSGLDLRIVHCFIPVNDVTIKPQYPMHRIDEVLETVIRPKHTCFFITDGSNGYWAVKIKPGDEYKAAFVTPHGQYLYLRMGQGLIGAPHTYAQFTDLVFGPLPKSSTQPRMDSLIGTHQEGGFSPFMDDHIGGFNDFDSQFQFLHTKYFPRVVFGPISLSASKTKVFVKTLELVGFM